MVISFFPQTDMENYAINKYNHFKFDKDRNLITTDHGAWCLLTDDEFDLLIKLKVHDDSNLFHVLKDKGVIITEDNFDKVAEMYKKRFHFLFKNPTLHIIVPTFRCNQRCNYCHSSSKNLNADGYDMDEDTARAIVDFIFQASSKLLVIEFQGGEPLLNFDMVKFIIEYAKKKEIEKHKDIKFSLVTNLTLMTEEKLDFLKRNKIMGIATSLDGPKELHDTNRKFIDGNGTYDDVVYWVKRIKTEFSDDFNLNALTTITKFSLPYYKEIPEELSRLGFNAVWLRFLNNLGFARSAWNEIGYTPDEYVNFYNKSLDHIMKINLNGADFSEIYATVFSRKILNEFDPMFSDIQSPCGAAIGQLTYDYKGDIFTCDEAKILEDLFKLGNVKTSTLADIAKNPTTSAMINLSSKLSTLCDACPLSPYCGICAVESYMTNGTIVPKLSMSFRCSVFKKMIKNIFERILFSENERKTLFKWAITSNLI